MQNPTGTFIVIEGADGSGKSTQFRLLAERIKAVGYKVEVFKFPRYDSGSSYFVKRYLNGDYGPAKNVSPYIATLFYALDRYEATPAIKKALAAGKVVICDRFVGSNMAHQGGKILDPIEQKSYFVWDDSLEYQLLGIPRPSINIFLRVPAEMSQKLATSDKTRKNRTYTDKSRDQHEMDINHLRKSVSTYEQLCQLFPNDFTAIDCVKDGQLMSILQINNLIWEVVQPLLPLQFKKTGHSVTLKLNVDKPKLNKLETESPALTKTNNLIMRERVSLLLSSTINQHPDLGLTTNLDWATTDYRYYSPPDLPLKSTQKYRLLMDELVQNRKKIDKKLKVKKENMNLAYPATPLSAILDVQLQLDRRATDKLISYLRTINSPEALSLANKVQAKAKLQWPGNHYQAKIVTKNRGSGQIDNLINRLVRDHLPQTLPDKTTELELLEFNPKNEFKLLVDILYPHSDLPAEKLEIQISNLNYTQKADTLLAALKNNRLGSLDQLLYKFDITSSRADLLKLRKIDKEATINAQAPTPRYGYEVPKAIDRADVTDEYLSVFDKSLEIYSLLQAAQNAELAAYGTLLGHKCRFQLICSLGSIFRLKAESKPPTNWTLVDKIIEQIALVHPIIGSVLVADTSGGNKRRSTSKTAAKKSQK